MAQVVLHLRAGVVGPQILEEPDELGRHELRLVEPVTLEEVEAARMSPIGPPKDVDAIGVAPAGCGTGCRWQGRREGR